MLELNDLILVLGQEILTSTHDSATGFWEIRMEIQKNMDDGWYQTIENCLWFGYRGILH